MPFLYTLLLVYGVNFDVEYDYCVRQQLMRDSQQDT